MFDTDGSGAIGSEELKGAMQSIGLEADDAEIERLIKEVKENGGITVLIICNKGGRRWKW